MDDDDDALGDFKVMKDAVAADTGGLGDGRLGGLGQEDGGLKKFIYGRTCGFCGSVVKVEDHAAKEDSDGFIGLDSAAAPAAVDKKGNVHSGGPAEDFEEKSHSDNAGLAKKRSTFGYKMTRRMMISTCMTLEAVGGSKTLIFTVLATLCSALLTIIRISSQTLAVARRTSQGVSAHFALCANKLDVSPRSSLCGL